MRKHLPNAVTCLNLFSGCIGVVLAFNDQLILASYTIIIALLFDFFDGMVARLLNVHSPMGKELDSLADMVSFGLLPAVIIFQLFKFTPVIDYDTAILPYSAFLLTIFSALRLAKFNIDQRQAEVFIGLPTPAAAMVVMSLPHIAQGKNLLVHAYVQNPVILLILTFTLSFLLVAELPLLSLKFKRLDFKSNKMRYILLFGAILLLFWLKLAAIPLIILWYILLSLLEFQNLGFR